MNIYELTFSDLCFVRKGLRDFSTDLIPPWQCFAGTVFRLIKGSRQCLTERFGLSNERVRVGVFSGKFSSSSSTLNYWL